jgi:hypothetical protein
VAPHRRRHGHLQRARHDCAAGHTDAIARLRHVADGDGQQERSDGAQAQTLHEGRLGVPRHHVK